MTTRFLCAFARVAVVVCVAGLVACEGPAGPNGADGEPGTSSDPLAGIDGGTTTGRSAAFVGGGLQVELLAAAIDSAGVASVEFKLTSDDGDPLDRLGVYTIGETSLNFVLAKLSEHSDGGPGSYTAYTKTTQTSDITDETAEQASSESDGTFEEIDPDQGSYRYTFSTTIDSPSMNSTHTVGVYATRNVDDQRYDASDTLDFVPNGSDVSLQRELVTDAACTSCHSEISAHGGARIGVKLCVLCHNPQTSDPDTGNTVDFPVMIHKIHMGEHLPSVQANTPYQIIGYRGSVHDYSTVTFPQPVVNCEACHQGQDADLHASRTTKSTCTSCHDMTSFEDPAPNGLSLHGGGAQPDNAQCTVCHPAAGSLAGIRDVHMDPIFDPNAPVLAFELLSVSNTAPGQQPVLDFKVTVDGAALDILTTPMDRLRATIAGPNTDFASYWQVTIQGSGASGTLSAIDANAGEFQYEFSAPNAIPVDATGSYTLALEGRIVEDTIRYAAFTETIAFAVTDSEAVPRRTVVSSDLCNNCHYSVAGHGGGRKGAKVCVLCHQASTMITNGGTRFEDDELMRLQTVDFKVMIHKIHMGEHLSQPYFLGGRPSESNPAGSPTDFGEIRYPRSPSDCESCHVQNTYILPLSLDMSPTLFDEMSCSENPGDDANDYCNDPYWLVDQTIEVPPETAVCTACHDQPATQAHAEVMTTTMGGEICAVCHGPGTVYDVAVVHSAP
ncbi:MAG: OmcA/MtrC family decaheme c-type cytochrome [Myxococcales bacterium]|nr:MAG: OmcA/MtrC family decaheme c-type cytochrome [Myxococcales bacterium]